MKNIVLFTDFGPFGPYVGEMVAAIRNVAPSVPVLELLNNAPTYDPKHSAYLLAALVKGFPPETIFLCVVDPGVGSERKAVVLEADGRFFVGPSNGLFNTVAKEAKEKRWFEIVWRPQRLSSSFHGRDLFAPVAAKIARGQHEELLLPWEGPDLSNWPLELAEVIYIDWFGNCWTGLRFRPELKEKRLQVAGRQLPWARTFSEVPKRSSFWYENASGLIEIAVNGGRADEVLGTRIGDPVSWSP